MKHLSFFTSMLLLGGAAFGAEEARPVMSHETAPPASSISHGIFWIADTAKMDRFLAQLDMGTISEGSYRGETLPDTRVVWRDYARQAWDSANRGDDAAVVERLGQMLKLAALYRHFGGLQNVAQGEEIRYLAGRMAQQLGYGGKLKSPYLEDNVQEVMALIERQAGLEKREVRPICWQHILEAAQVSYARLSGQPLHALSGVASSGYYR